MARTYDKLVNKAFSGSSRVELKRTETLQLDGEEIEFTQPFITISREPGSGGKPVAKLVSKWLSFDYYNKKLISDLASSARKRKALVQSVDERGRNFIEDMVHSMFNPDYVSDIQYMRYLSSVILSAAIKGEVVILGRGANFVTPFNSGLHVRIQAPYLVRVERAVKHEGISRDKAIHVIKDTDTHRKQFISQYFNKDISNANYYDLVINTADMNIQDAAEHVVLALKNKFPDYAKKRKKLFRKLLLTF